MCRPSARSLWFVLWLVSGLLACTCAAASAPPPGPIAAAWFTTSRVLGAPSSAAPASTVITVEFASQLHYDSIPPPVHNATDLEAWGRAVRAEAAGAVLRCGRAIYSILTPLAPRSPPVAPATTTSQAQGKEGSTATAAGVSAAEWAAYDASLRSLRFSVSSSSGPIASKLPRCRVLLPPSQRLTDAAGEPLLPTPTRAQRVGGSPWAAATALLASAPPENSAAAAAAAAAAAISAATADMPAATAAAAAAAGTMSSSAGLGALYEEEEAELVHDLLAPAIAELSSAIKTRADDVKKSDAAAKTAAAASVDAAIAAAEAGGADTSVFLELAADASPAMSSFVVDIRARARAAAAAASSLNSEAAAAAAAAAGGNKSSNPADAAVEEALGVPLSTSIADATILLQTGASATVQTQTLASAAASLHARHLVRHAQRMAADSAAFLRLASQLEAAARARATLSHGVIWQVVIRPLMVMAREYIRRSMQETQYQIVKGTTTPAIAAMICMGETELPNGMDPKLPTEEDLIDPTLKQGSSLDESAPSNTPEYLQAYPQAKPDPMPDPAPPRPSVFLEAETDIDAWLTEPPKPDSELFTRPAVNTAAAVSAAAIAAATEATGGAAAAAKRRAALSSSLPSDVLDMALGEIERSPRAQHLIAAVRQGRADAEPELKALVAAQLAAYEARLAESGEDADAAAAAAHAAEADHHDYRSDRHFRSGSAGGDGTLRTKRGETVLYGVPRNAFDRLPAGEAAAKRKLLRDRVTLRPGELPSELGDDFINHSGSSDGGSSGGAGGSDQMELPAMRTSSIVTAKAAALMDREAQNEHFNQQQHALQAEYARAAGAVYVPNDRSSSPAGLADGGASLAEMGASASTGAATRVRARGRAGVRDDDDDDDDEKPLNAPFSPPIKPPGIGMFMTDGEGGTLVLDIVKWIVDPLVANLEPAVLSAVEDASIDAIALDVDAKLRRTLNATLLRDVTRGTVTMIINRLTYSFTQRISHGLIRRLIPEVTHKTAGPLLSALSHSLAMTLSRSLTRNPSHDEHCFFCGSQPDAAAPPEDATKFHKACNICRVSRWNEYYLDYYTTYYTQYFYGYYGYYYADYFSRVFAEEQLVILEDAQLLAAAKLNGIVEKPVQQEPDPAEVDQKENEAAENAIVAEMDEASNKVLAS